MNKCLAMGIVMCAVADYACAADSSGQASTLATTPSQTISRSGEQAPIYGAADYFTGRVRVDPLFSPNESINASGAYVTFEPGAVSYTHLTLPTSDLV